MTNIKRNDLTLSLIIRRIGSENARRGLLIQREPVVG
jgi:hypothetical protein